MKLRGKKTRQKAQNKQTFDLNFEGEIEFEAFEGKKLVKTLKINKHLI